MFRIIPILANLSNDDMDAQIKETNLNSDNRCIGKRNERLLPPHMPIQFHQPSSKDKHKVEQFIAEQFSFHYQAKVTHFHPYLLSTKTDGEVTAAMGFQPAETSKPIFIEQYLNLSIEDEINLITKHSVARSKIVEVGNSTSNHRGTSQLLFVLTIAILHESGFEWSVFTATKQVQQLLSRLNLVTVTLCEADQDKLTGNPQVWGSYYDNKPNVLIGNLTDAIALLKEHKVISFILENYQDTINDTARRIKLK